MKVVRLSASCTGDINPQEIFVVLISVRGWFHPRSIVQPEGIWQWKIAMSPSRIEPTTFLLVAIACPHKMYVTYTNVKWIRGSLLSIVVPCSQCSRVSGVWKPVRVRKFSLLQNIQTVSAFYFMSIGVLSWRQSSWGMILTTHLHLALKSGMSRSIALILPSPAPHKPLWSTQGRGWN